MTHLDTGKVQIYTGDGKGKTTAAMGLAFRATGYGLNVLMLQFVKKLHCSEHDAAAHFGLPILQATRNTPAECAQQIMEMARMAVSEDDRASDTPTSPDCGLPCATPVDVLILDEVGEAMRRGFVAREDIEQLIALKPETTELVMTGRGLTPLADLADLVTEMRPVKHYFDEGLLARKGIEY